MVTRTRESKDYYPKVKGVLIEIIREAFYNIVMMLKACMKNSENVEVDDDIKRYNLLGNLESVDSTEAKFLTHHCRANFSTFDEYLACLKMYISCQD